MTTTAQLGRCSLPLVILAIVSSHIQNKHPLCAPTASRLFFFLFSFFYKKKRSRLVNACFYHTYNCVKLAQPMSNTSTPWGMLSMEMVALLKSSNKHLLNARRNQTYCPSQPLTKAVLESISQAAPSRTVLQTVWCLGYSAEYRQVGCCQEICASLPKQDKEYKKDQLMDLQRWGCLRVCGWIIYLFPLLTMMSENSAPERCWMVVLTGCCRRETCGDQCPKCKHSSALELLTWYHCHSGCVYLCPAELPGHQ